MREKILGYILLGTGILIMAASVYLVYQVLANKIKPLKVYQPDVVAETQEPVSLQNLMNDPSAMTQMQSQLLSQILDKQMSKTVDLGATIFLMYFLMLFGFRLSTLGVQLMRPIQVKLSTAVPPKPPVVKS